MSSYMYSGPDDANGIALSQQDEPSFGFVAGSPMSEAHGTPSDEGGYITVVRADDGKQNRNEVVELSEMGRRATDMYGSRKKELGKKMLMSTGKRIDYIIVYQLPQDEEDRKKLLEEARQPARGDEEKAVKNARKRSMFEEGLRKMGAVLEKEIAKDNRTIFIKVHAPFEILLQEAENVRMRLALNNEETKEREEMLSVADQFKNWFQWNKIKEKVRWLNVFDSGIEPDEDYYSAVFRRDRREEFQNYDDEDKLFSDSQRALLVHHMLNSVQYSKKNDQIGIKRLLNNGSYLDCFPLHDSPAEPENPEEEGNRSTLYRVWGGYFDFYKMQPHDLIRRYFGEKVAIYFVWLGFYTRALILPSFIGILVFIYGLGTYEDQEDAKELCASTLTMCPLCDSCDKWNLSTACTAYKFSWVFDNGGTIAFAFIMSIWASVFLDFWKRRNAELAYDWDVRDFHEEEPDRPQFKSKKTRINPVTGEEEKYYPTRQKAMKYLGTILTIAFMLGLVIVVLISIILYRLAVRVALFKSCDEPDCTGRKSSGIISAISASVINLIMILLLNRIYGVLAIRLTDWENHRKESLYEAHLALKIFLFQFVNSYASLFYIAFFKGQNTGRPGAYKTFLGFRQDECPEYGCLLELTIQLAIIMVGKQSINNAQEVLIPMIKGWLAKRSKKDMMEKEGRLPWEEEFVSLQIYPRMGMFYEYLEMIIQFGFITLFVAAFPLGPLFALGNNILEIRVDAGKLCTVYRRPPASRAANIGVWQGILQFVSFFSVVTNGLVIAITSSYITKRVYEDRFDTMAGYVLATHPPAPTTVTDPSQSNCNYASLRDPDGEKGSFYYEVWSARLGFLIIFEHIVFLTKFAVQAAIPDIPHAIVVKVKREAFLAKQALEGVLEGDNEGNNNNNNNNRPTRSNMPTPNQAVLELQQQVDGPSFEQLYPGYNNEDDEDDGSGYVDPNAYA